MTEATNRSEKALRSLIKSYVADSEQPLAFSWVDSLVRQNDALVAVRDAAKAYYDFTRSPEPQGFNNQYNMRAIRVGEALFAALEQVK